MAESAPASHIPRCRMGRASGLGFLPPASEEEIDPMAVALVTLTALVLLAAGVPARAVNVDVGEGVDAVTDCVKANQPRLSAEQTVTLRTVDRTGAARDSEATIYWQKFGEKSKALIRFNAPPDLRGSALLLLEQDERVDMFMYLPELRRVRRVSKHSVAGSMFGTDFTYEDFERLQGLGEDGELQRLPDAEVDGRKVFVLEGRPSRGEQSAYERSISFVDQESCIPIRTELYEKGERLRKLLVIPAEEITREGEIWVPRHVLVKDLVNETRTELLVDEIELNKKFSRKLFSESALESRSH